MPQERTMLQQRITLIEQGINKLVYELYGLTSEEINIVEGEG